MKKIEFGYNEAAGSSWEGLGIKKGVMLLDADYYGVITYNGDNYIIAKVVEDKYNRFPNLVDKFIVRQALCDLYADGSAVLLLNAEGNSVTNQLESSLNSMEVKNNINSIEDIIYLGQGICRAPRSFVLTELGEKVVATSIPAEAFIVKNEAIKQCQASVSEMQMERNNNYSLR